MRAFLAWAGVLVLLGAPAAAHAAPASGPQIVSFTAAAGSVSCAGSGVHVSCAPQGGTVTLTLKVKGAVSCTFFRRRDPTSALIRWKAVACPGSVMHVQASVPANNVHDDLTVGFVVRARARSGATAAKNLTVTVAGLPVTDPPETPPPAPQPEPVPPLQPPWPPPPGSDGKSSSNWAGFWVSGGPFTAAHGTFTVPAVTPSLAGGTDAVEWVGIDGVDNASLIQAGIEETYDPATKSDTTTAWWEILPATQTPVDGFRVQPGDQVTVVIWQFAGSTWVIDINDDTNGQHFQTKQTYTGPASSVDWIVEAPTSASGEQETIGAFNPNVTFTNNWFTGTATVKAMVLMVQHGRTIVIPSPMNQRDDFAVAFGGGGAITPP